MTMDGDTAAIIGAVAAAVSGSLGYIWRMQQQAREDRKIEQREENQRAAAVAQVPATAPSPGVNGYVRPEKVAEMLNIHQDRCTKVISNTLTNMAITQRAAHEEVRSDIHRIVDSLDEFKTTVVERLGDHGARIKVLEETP